MASVLEPAASGRSRCRGCGRPIQRAELRFGERVPNPFAEGEVTIWFHPLCAACKRPEKLLEVSPTLRRTCPIDTAWSVRREAPSLIGASHGSTAPTVHRTPGPIERGRWRIRPASFEDGRFSPGGYVHLDCRKAYFETGDILDQVLHFSPTLTDGEREELRRLCDAGS